MSINLHINASLAVALAGGASANFGTARFLAEHSISANRSDGPYSSIAEVEAAGFTAAAQADVHGWASAVFAQNPRTASVLVGRRLPGEHVATAMSAIEAAYPAQAYVTNMASNTPNDIMALAAWTETRAKIAVAQSSDAALAAGTASTQQVSNFTIGAAATDGVYSIAVTNAWTGAAIGTASFTASSDDDDAIAAGLRSAWDAVAALAAVSEAAAGASEVVAITFDGLGNGYDFALTSPGDILTVATPAFVQNVLQLGSALGYNQTAVVYHDDDTEYLDGAWCGRCLGFALESPQGNGSWAYHKLVGVTATSQTSAAKTAILASNGNFYAPVTYTSGVEESGFTWEGIMLSGRFIDIQVTLDLTQARIEEAILQAFLRAASTNRPGIGFDDDGIGLLAGAALSVLDRLVRARHYRAGALSSLTQRRTPYVDAPAVSSLSPAQRSGRIVTLTSEAVFGGFIHSVGDPATVGITLDLSF